MYIARGKQQGNNCLMPSSPPPPSLPSMSRVVSLYRVRNTVIVGFFYEDEIYVRGWDLAEWLEPLTANAEVATILGSIPASSDKVEYEGRRKMKQCWIFVRRVPDFLKVFHIMCSP
jgi:hypothetical protein